MWMKWVRVRGLVEGVFQRARLESDGAHARDGALRPQDYGFAANPVDGEGLKLEVGGHTILLRVDRTAERPQLPAYEVAVWHQEGHMVRLRAGRVVQVDCDQYVVNASAGVVLNTPSVSASGSVIATGDVVGAGTSLHGHVHGNSGPPS